MKLVYLSDVSIAYLEVLHEDMWEPAGMLENYKLLRKKKKKQIVQALFWRLVPRLHTGIVLQVQVLPLNCIQALF